MFPDEQNDHQIIDRATGYVPPHTWRHWFFCRPLATGDTLHQTIGKFITDVSYQVLLSEIIKETL